MKPDAILPYALLAGLLMAVPAAADAQRQRETAAGSETDAPCLTEREMQAVTTWLLPDGIDGLARRCRGMLSNDAFLSTSGAALAERYRNERSTDGDLARRALAGATGGLPLSLFGDDVSGVVIVEAALQQMKPQDCAKADRLTALLSPLPRASIGEVAAMLIATGLRNADTSGLPIRLCRAAR